MIDCIIIKDNYTKVKLKSSDRVVDVLEKASIDFASSN